MTKKEITLDKLREERDKAKELFEKRHKELEHEIRETFELRYFSLITSNLNSLRSRVLILEFMIENNITADNPMKMREILNKIKDRKTPVWKTHLLSPDYYNRFNPNNLGIIGSRGKKPGYYVADMETAKKWVEIARKIVKV